MATLLAGMLTSSILIAISFGPLVQAQDAPLAQIPTTLPPSEIKRLAGVRAQLMDRLGAHNQEVDAFNSRCGTVQGNTPLFGECVKEDKALSAELETLTEDKKSFAVAVRSASDQAACAAASGAAANAKGISDEEAKLLSNSQFDTGCRVEYVPLPLKPSGATPLDPRFAKDKDYQAAATELTKAQTLADTLNQKMKDLQDQQKASPTPERQIEIYDLSAQTNRENGAVAIAKINLDTVKKKIISGPAIIVGGSPTFADISLNQWLALTPPELVQGHLALGADFTGHLDKTKHPVV